MISFFAFCFSDGLVLSCLVLSFIYFGWLWCWWRFSRPWDFSLSLSFFRENYKIWTSGTWIRPTTNQLRIVHTLSQVIFWLSTFLTFRSFINFHHFSTRSTRKYIFGFQSLCSPTLNTLHNIRTVHNDAVDRWWFSRDVIKSLLRFFALIMILNMMCLWKGYTRTSIRGIDYPELHKTSLD